MAWYGLATALRSGGGYLCLLFFTAGLATGALAQSGTSAASSSSEQGCVKTRCPTPSCFRKYAGGYFNRCPNGDFPIKNPYGEPKPAEPAQPTPPPAAQTQPDQQRPHVVVQINAQSLAGDWEYSLNGPQKLVLHLRTGPGGALVGSVDTPDTPPKHVELSNIQLTNRMLKYTWPGLGTFTEVVNADGKGMVGAHIWVRPSTAAAQATH